jgi:hypothetical protein
MQFDDNTPGPTRNPGDSVRSDIIHEYHTQPPTYAILFNVSLTIEVPIVANKVLAVRVGGFFLPVTGADVRSVMILQGINSFMSVRYLEG